MGNIKFTVEHRAWVGMRRRCYYPKHTSYKYYGARGVEVSPRWLGENGFRNFLADVGHRPAGKTSLDRIDNDGNYEPGNVRWADQTEQNLNRRLMKNNTSGCTGVSFHTSRNKWKAYISYKKRPIYLGFYDKRDEAVKARKTGETLLGTELQLLLQIPDPRKRRAAVRGYIARERIQWSR